MARGTERGHDSKTSVADEYTRLVKGQDHRRVECLTNPPLEN